MWSLAKNLLGRGCGAPIDGISIKSPSGELLSQAKEKANLFRQVFDVSSKLCDSHTGFHPSVQEHIDKEDGNGINSAILMAEVDAMIASLKPCAMGADLIHNLMLKNLNSENKNFDASPLKSSTPHRFCPAFLETSHCHPAHQTRQTKGKCYVVQTYFSHVLFVQGVREDHQQPPHLVSGF